MPGWQGRGFAHFAFLREDIPRHFQCGRSLAPGKHLQERTRHARPRLIGRIHAIRPFHETPHGRQLIRHLMQMPPAFSQKGVRHLTGEHQDGFVAPKSRQQAGAGIQHSRPRDDREDGRTSGGPAIAKCHVGAGLLMPCADDFDVFLCPMKRVEQAIGLSSGEPENRVDMMVLQASHQRFAAGHFCQRSPLQNRNAIARTVSTEFM